MLAWVGVRIPGVSYVATIPPTVPRVTTQLLDTARTAEPPVSRSAMLLVVGPQKYIA